MPPWLVGIAVHKDCEKPKKGSGWIVGNPEVIAKVLGNELTGQVAPRTIRGPYSNVEAS